MATGRIPDPNTAPVTAKGDLYTYSTVPAKLVVGSDGDTLLADSSQTTGLRWGSNLGFTAGKNKIINGDFRIWQRGTSFAQTGGSPLYNADRFATNGGYTGGTHTSSRQTFTAGTAPVSGYEGWYYIDVATTGASGTGDFGTQLIQRIEDVRTFANQTVTLSFWAKASTTINTCLAYLEQYFGTGGSPSANVRVDKNFNLTTSWQRFTLTFTVGSISGKTIGTANDSYLVVGICLPAATNATFSVWGVQLEAGSVATAFQTATGTLAGELAACQRYYTKSYNLATAPGTASTTAGCEIFMALAAYVSNNLRQQSRFKVTMRAAPTVTLYSTNSGTAAKWYNEGLATDVNADVFYIGEQGFLSYQSAGTTNATNVLLFHYAASAEL